MTTNFRPILLSDYAQPRRRQLFDGTTKTVFDGPEPGTHVLYFKDDLILENEVETISGKGILNNRISELLMSRLNELNIETHFIRTLNMREQLIRATESFSFSLTVHNVACDSFAKRLGLEDGTTLAKPIPEFSLRSRELNNPVIAAEHITSLGWSRFEEIDEMLLTSQRVNDFLSGQFLALNIRLISFTLQFGRCFTSDLMESQILITDELSPESINLFDLVTSRRLDHSGMEEYPERTNEIYKEIAYRLGVLELENSDGMLAPLFEGKLSQIRSPGEQFKQRKKPHGHNSL